MGILAWIFLMVLYHCLTSAKGFQRPVWNYAHQVNTIHQVEEFLDLGANAIEADITFNNTGQAEFTYHGWPCDCFRNCRPWEYVNNYLDYVRKITSPESGSYRKKFILLGLDLKLGKLRNEQKSGAMADLARRLISHLWNNGRATTKVRVLIHLPKVSDIAYVKPFLEHFKSKGFSSLKDRIGFEVYGSESLNHIGNLWAALNLTVNLWQSDGITNCLPRGTTRLQEILNARNTRNSWIRKVFWWTVDKSSTIRTILRMGVDGVMTNHPDRVQSVLQEQEFKGRFRLATEGDDPYLKFDGALYSAWNNDIPDVIENLDLEEEILTRKF